MQAEFSRFFSIPSLQSEISGFLLHLHALGLYFTIYKSHFYIAFRSVTGQSGIKKEN